MPFPSKVFDYLAAGKPILLAIDGIIREVVEGADAGVFAQPGDPEAIASAIRVLREDPGRLEEMAINGRQCATRHYNRDDHARLLGDLLVDLASGEAVQPVGRGVPAPHAEEPATVPLLGRGIDVTTPLGPSSRLKTKPDVVYTSMEDEDIILNLASRRYYGLNESGSYIWQLLLAGLSIGDVTDALCREYLVDPPEAQAAVVDLCRESVREGLLEIVEPSA
jgi:hypothetical protein